MNLSTSPSGSVQLQSATSSSLSSLIKVSPLKSLLREDLKRKIVTRSSSSARRNATSPNNSENVSSDPATTTNGAITSTGPEQPSDSTVWRTSGKRSLSSLQCTYCGIGFPDQTLYFLHKGCHSDANPWKCNICGEQCCNVYEFNSHLLSKSHQWNSLLKNRIIATNKKYIPLYVIIYKQSKQMPFLRNNREHVYYVQSLLQCDNCWAFTINTNLIERVAFGNCTKITSETHF